MTIKWFLPSILSDHSWRLSAHARWCIFHVPSIYWLEGKKKREQKCVCAREKRERERERRFSPFGGAFIVSFLFIAGKTLYLLDVTYATASTLAKCVYFYFVASWTCIALLQSLSLSLSPYLRANSAKQTLYAFHWAICVKAEVLAMNDGKGGLSHDNWNCTKYQLRSTREREREREQWNLGRAQVEYMYAGSN